MGIQFYNGLSNYNYRLNIPEVELEPVKTQEPKIENNAKNLETPVSITESAPVRQSKVADLEDISLTFNKEDDFSHIGKDVSVMSLDMEKAISDMKKDDILQDYNYFVGSSKNLFSEDGIVIAK